MRLFQAVHFFCFYIDDVARSQPSLDCFFYLHDIGTIVISINFLYVHSTEMFSLTHSERLTWLAVSRNYSGNSWINCKGTFFVMQNRIKIVCASLINFMFAAFIKLFDVA